MPSGGIKCRLEGTPFSRQACSISLLLALATPSSSAWTRNTGGVCGVTCRSAEHSSARSAPGAGPRILLRVPPWVVLGSMVMTG